MKKISFLLIFVFSFLFEQSYAQCGKWALEFEGGTHKVSDESALTKGYPIHAGLGIRYNLNPKVGIGVTTGYDFGKIEDFYFNSSKFNYARLNAEGYLNIFNILDLQNKVFTLIAHGGPGVSHISVTNNNHSEYFLNFNSGLTGLFRLSNSVALKADYSVISHFNQKKTLDGAFTATNEGINSTVNNYSVGLVFYLGSKKSKKAHADWYATPKIDTIQAKNLNPITNNYYNIAPTPIKNDSMSHGNGVAREVISVTNNYYYKTDSILIAKTVKCEHTYRAFVFFEHDKWDFSKAYLDGFYEMSLYLKENPGSLILIKAWASPTNSTDEYNLELSKKRCQAIYDKYVALGVNPALLKMDWFGKDYNLKPELVHDIARRVEILLVKNQK